MEDWGESGTPLARLQETNNHAKSERKFQLLVLSIFSGFCLVVILLQACNVAIVAKDLILLTLPVFTFVLGKLETKNG